VDFYPLFDLVDPFGDFDLPGTGLVKTNFQIDTKTYKNHAIVNDKQTRIINLADIHLPYQRFCK
jgi:hypothetical protein